MSYDKKMFSALAVVVVLVVIVVVILNSFDLSYSTQQLSSKVNVSVEMLQGNGTYWIFFGDQIYQSDNQEELLQYAQNYFEGKTPP